MDLTGVIETHRAALKRIVAGLVAMIGGRSTLFPQRGAADSRLALAEKSRLSPALPRRLHRAVLRLLRPAESATRRLVITLARGLPRSPAPCEAGRPVAKAKVASISVRTRIGRWRTPTPGQSADQLPRETARRPLFFPLLDPLRLRSRRRRGARAAGTPRICIPGITGHVAVPARKPPLPDDPLDAGRLCQRLVALAQALDDLPGQARRFLRWQARRDRALASGRIHRVGPLRGGRPPGGRLSRYQPDAPRRRRVREVDEILAHAHALAHYALNPDAS